MMNVWRESDIETAEQFKETTARSTGDMQ